MPAVGGLAAPEPSTCQSKCQNWSLASSSVSSESSGRQAGSQSCSATAWHRSSVQCKVHCSAGCVVSFLQRGLIGLITVSQRVCSGLKDRFVLCEQDHLACLGQLSQAKRPKRGDPLLALSGLQVLGEPAMVTALEITRTFW